jgi:hypothetical protein
MKHFYWDSCNKWLYLGPDQSARVVIQFDNWLGWKSSGPYLTIRQWTAFEIMWDNGAWWASDLRPVAWDKERSTEWAGLLNCFVQVIILGIGIRVYYKRTGKVVMTIDEGVGDVQGSMVIDKEPGQ